MLTSNSIESETKNPDINLFLEVKNVLHSRFWLVNSISISISTFVSIYSSGCTQRHANRATSDKSIDQDVILSSFFILTFLQKSSSFFVLSLIFLLPRENVNKSFIWFFGYQNWLSFHFSCFAVDFWSITSRFSANREKRIFISFPELYGN